MPTRLIRDSCCSSPSLAALSASAERLFFRLLTTADDFGRFRADVPVVRAACFPLLLSRYSEARVRGLLRELAQQALIRLYQSEGRWYGVFVTWSKYQYLRAKLSKFPAPPEFSQQMLQASQQLLNSSQQMLKSSQQISSETETETETETYIKNTPPTPPQGELSTGFAQFWHSYPKKVGRKAAETAFRRLGPTPPLEAMLAALAAQRATRQWQDRQFIPHPATWLNGRRWEDEPARDGRAAVAGEAAPAGAPLSEAQRERLRQLTESVGK